MTADGMSDCCRRLLSPAPRRHSVDAEVLRGLTAFGRRGISRQDIGLGISICFVKANKTSRLRV
jgi:hypothetical protein